MDMNQRIHAAAVGLPENIEHCDDKYDMNQLQAADKQPFSKTGVHLFLLNILMYCNPFICKEPPGAACRHSRICKGHPST